METFFGQFLILTLFITFNFLRKKNVLVSNINDLKLNAKFKYHILIDEFLTNDPRMEFGDHSFRVEEFKKEIKGVEFFCKSSGNKVLTCTVVAPEIYRSIKYLKTMNNKFHNWDLFDFGGKNYRCSSEIIRFIMILQNSIHIFKTDESLRTFILPPIGNQSFSSNPVKFVAFETLISREDYADNLKYTYQQRLNSDAMELYSDSLIITSPRMLERYIMSVYDFLLVRSTVTTYSNDTNRTFLAVNGAEYEKVVIILDGQLKKDKDGKYALVNSSFQNCILDLFKIITRCRYDLVIVYPGSSISMDAGTFAYAIQHFTNEQQQRDKKELTQMASFGLFDDLKKNESDFFKEIDWIVMHEKILGNKFMNETTRNRLSRYGQCWQIRMQV